ncbi:CCR4-NOT regulatory complex component [Chytridiales sp. JEL 0842]|nr:CCR4-NOT regulatory complex component [Chytridiales sp. JEL 0842]
METVAESSNVNHLGSSSGITNDSPSAAGLELTEEELNLVRTRQAYAIHFLSNISLDGQPLDNPLTMPDPAHYTPSGFVRPYPLGNTSLPPHMSKALFSTSPEGSIGSYPSISGNHGRRSGTQSGRLSIPGFGSMRDPGHQGKEMDAIEIVVLNGNGGGGGGGSEGSRVGSSGRDGTRRTGKGVENGGRVTSVGELCEEPDAMEEPGDGVPDYDGQDKGVGSDGQVPNSCVIAVNELNGTSGERVPITATSAADGGHSVVIDIDVDNRRKRKQSIPQNENLTAVATVEEEGNDALDDGVAIHAGSRTNHGLAEDDTTSIDVLRPAERPLSAVSDKPPISPLRPNVSTSNATTANGNTTSPPLNTTHVPYPPLANRPSLADGTNLDSSSSSVTSSISMTFPLKDRTQTSKTASSGSLHSLSHTHTNTGSNYTSGSVGPRNMGGALYDFAAQMIHATAAAITGASSSQGGGGASGMGSGGHQGLFQSVTGGQMVGSPLGMFSGSNNSLNGSMENQVLARTNVMGARHSLSGVISAAARRKGSFGGNRQVRGSASEVFGAMGLSNRLSQNYQKQTNSNMGPVANVEDVETPFNHDSWDKTGRNSETAPSITSSTGGSMNSNHRQLISGRNLSKYRTSTESTSTVMLEKLLESRITFLGPQGTPLSMMSIIPYIDVKGKSKRVRKARFGSQAFERMGIALEAVKRKTKNESFQHLLTPSNSLSPVAPDYSVYNPNFLDDPELKTGKHKTVITLPCFIGSIIQYTRPGDIKKELNEHFRETHPTVDAMLTLSQIRNLKARLLEVGLQRDLELSSVACAYVLFEKLVLKNYVTKANRRLIAAVCLLLAAKVNDPKETDYAKLVAAMEEALEVSAKDIFQQEFTVYTWLDFSLFVAPWEMMPHLERILASTGLTMTSDKPTDTSNFTLTQRVVYETRQLPPTTLAVHIDHLDFDFGAEPILTDVSLSLERGSRCLLVGANGAGKSTLLRILAGKTLVKRGVRVLGNNPFFEKTPGITYLGTEWVRNPIVTRDVPVARLLKTLGAERHSDRCSRLLDILDVDVNWHMHTVSDGQRRRVQIVLGLLEPWDILLLDEVTVDLDVLVRKDLLDFLKEETEVRGATILYATHIFDGLGGWPSHVVHIAEGKIDMTRVVKKDGFPELDEARAARFNGGVLVDDGSVDNSPLLNVVEKWLREDYKNRKRVTQMKDGKGKLMTRWEMLSENMKEYGDKFYDYSH